MESDEDLALLRERLALPEDEDVALDEFAAELGLDIESLRADVRAGRIQANIATH